MIILGKIKRKLDSNFSNFADGTKVIPAIGIQDQVKDILFKIGFTQELDEGETVLPSSELGPICKYNAEGKYIVHKDRPMETAYRQAEWTWEQWAGYWGTETQSRIVDIPYKRYPRTFVFPPSIELSIAKNSNGQKYIVAPECKISFQKPETLLHSINIFLELFGRCEILLENLDGYIIKNLKRLNWKVLPPGKWPWEKIEKEVKSLIEKVSEQKQIVIEYRLKTITECSPEFVAIGQAGFSGYLICGFPEKNLYVLESLFLGNATYIFQESWEELSKLTKAEILNENLQKDRIIHRKHWRSHINNLLK